MPFWVYNAACGDNGVLASQSPRAEPVHELDTAEVLEASGTRRTVLSGSTTGDSQVRSSAPRPAESPHVGHVDVAGVRYELPDGRVLLDDVSFRVGEGAKVALVGANGAGKTTLLRIITGDLTPHAGVVTRSRRPRRDAPDGRRRPR